MKTVNKILCITGTSLSLGAFLFFIDAISNDAITIINTQGKYVWQNKSNKILCGFDDNETVAAEICEKIRQKIEEARPCGILTTCSFGIAKMEKTLSVAYKMPIAQCTS